MFLIWWLVQKLKITALWPNDSITLNSYETFSNSIPKWTTFEKKIFDSMVSLEIDKMTALWQKEWLTFTFYERFGNRIPNWTNFVKEIFVQH